MGFFSSEKDARDKLNSGQWVSRHDMKKVGRSDRRGDDARRDAERAETRGDDPKKRGWW